MPVLSALATKLDKWFQRYKINSKRRILTVPTSKSRGTAYLSSMTELAAYDLSDTTISFASVTATTMTINWTTVTNATNYVLERTTDPKFKTGITQRYTGPLLTFADSGLVTNTIYYYRLTATATGFGTAAVIKSQKTA